MEVLIVFATCAVFGYLFGYQKREFKEIHRGFELTDRMASLERENDGLKKELRRRNVSHDRPLPKQGEMKRRIKKAMLATVKEHGEVLTMDDLKSEDALNAIMTAIKDPFDVARFMVERLENEIESIRSLRESPRKEGKE